ncbi:hypothetical protein LWC35_18595 [Pseudonocardia kujensis]|uniref:SWIM zinc finger family protein n=1 Tax=Pseudonocardia kujensis TaxID=1128675 RepID=UPI001E57E9E4|nr:hypothetical protein [Pseudonocardia kujensis]MCE0764897.1 hypothetical protein [Pseudonocardia kujensis]
MIGSEPYAVELDSGPDGFKFRCSCPVGVSGSFCKHCVALALVAAGSPNTAPHPRAYLETLSRDIDEDVDYDQALAAGHTTAAALTAMAGVVIGNGVFYLADRGLLRRPAISGRPWVLYFFFWYIAHSVGNFYDYVPLRTFAADGDVKNFALATGWSRWWIYGVAGYLTLWAVVDLFRRAMPWTLDAAGFGRVRAARAIVLVLSTLALFVLYALPALEQADPVSVFMGRTSLIIIPAVLIATWRRNVLAEGPPAPGRRIREERVPEQDAPVGAHTSTVPGLDPGPGGR